PSRAESSREHRERTSRMNVFGFVFMLRAWLPLMRAGATIIAIGSETGIVGARAAGRLGDSRRDSGCVTGQVHAELHGTARDATPACSRQLQAGALWQNSRMIVSRCWLGSSARWCG